MTSVSGPYFHFCSCFRSVTSVSYHTWQFYVHHHMLTVKDRNFGGGIFSWRAFALSSAQWCRCWWWWPNERMRWMKSSAVSVSQNLSLAHCVPRDPLQGLHREPRIFTRDLSLTLSLPDLLMTKDRRFGLYFSDVSMIRFLVFCPESLRFV